MILQSSNPDVATLPPSVTVPAGSASLNVPFTLSNQGTTVFSGNTSGDQELSAQVFSE